MLRSQDVNPGELYGVLSVGFVCAHKMSYLCVINYMGNVIWDMHCFMNQPHRIQLIVGAHMVLGRVLTLVVAVVTGIAGAAAQVLWRVTADGPAGAGHTSYVLGTMHTAGTDVLDSLAGLDGALEHVAAVYVEVLSSDMALTPEAMACAIAPSDSTLQRLLSPAALDSVCRYVSTFGVDGARTLEALGRFRPAMLDAYLEVRRSSASTGVPMDIALQHRATAMGKDVRALETAEQQVRMLMGTPVAEQLEALMESVRAPEAAQAASDSLVAAYRCQDLEAIGRLLARGMREAYAERMVYARNRAWAAVLVPEMRCRSVLVAVGAGHLVGPEGLLAMLRSAGFDVSPVGGSGPRPEQRR